jgi:hypothetical protein
MVEGFGSVGDSAEHRGHVEKINQAKRDLGEPDPARLVARSCSDNDPGRARVDGSQDEDPAEVQVQTTLNQTPFERVQGRRVVWIDWVPPVGVSDRYTIASLSSIRTTRHIWEAVRR